jgi:hypothetical protein
MSWPVLAWLFALAVTLHNAEEAILLPVWSRKAGRWHVSVAAADFRFAVLVLTAAAFVCAWLSDHGSTVGDYLLCGYALAMLLNVFVPHLAATIVLWRYAPGTGTALGLILPTASLLLWRGLAEGRIELARFAWAGPLTVAVILLSIPLLFALGVWARTHIPDPVPHGKS